MDKLIQEQLQIICSSLFCQLCNVKISSESVELSHYNSQRHLNHVAEFKSKMRKELIPTKLRKNAYATVTKTQSEHGSGPSLHAEDLPGRNNRKVMARTAYCFICNKAFDSKSELQEHAKVFPHLQLAKLKSQLIKQGILSEYWTIHSDAVECTICQARLPAFAQMNSHFNSYNHTVSYNNWCISNLPRYHTTGPTHVPKNIPRSISEWFHCNACNCDLNGTTIVEEHYASPIHIKNTQRIATPQPPEQKRYAKEPLSDFQSTTLNIPLERKKSTLDAENQTKNEIIKFCPPEDSNVVKRFATNHCDGNNIASVTTPSPFPKLLNSEQVDNKDELSNETSHLKEQVFHELDRLIQKLYYSKTVPYKVSLEYLKRINNDVDQLSKKYSIDQNGSEKNAVIEAKSKTSTQEFNGRSDDYDNNINSSIDQLAHKRKSYEDTKNDCSMDFNFKNIQPTNVQKKSSSNPSAPSACSKELPLPKEAITSVIKKTDYNRTDFQTHSDDTVNTLSGNFSFEESFSSDEVRRGTANLADLMAEVKIRSLETLFDSSEEGPVERELLNEIEKLLQQISKGDIPLEETLKCLEKYNKELDEQIFKSDDQIKESLDILLRKEESEEGHLADGETTDKEDIIEVRNLNRPNRETYSKINKGGHTVFYADDAGRRKEMDSEVSLETSASQSEPVMLFESSKSNENRLKLGFYNYYEGNNFWKFADFYNVFLQRSVEEVQNWNEVRNRKALLVTKQVVEDVLESSRNDRRGEKEILNELDSEVSLETSEFQSESDLPFESCESYENRLKLGLYNYYIGNNSLKYADFCDVFLQGSVEEVQNWNAVRNRKALLVTKQVVEDVLESSRNDRRGEKELLIELDSEVSFQSEPDLPFESCESYENRLKLELRNRKTLPVTIPVGEDVLGSSSDDQKEMEYRSSHLKQDMWQEARDTHECSLSLHLFNYYTESNFHEFTDFLNVYLQGSTEHLETTSARKNQVESGLQ